MVLFSGFTTERWALVRLLIGALMISLSGVFVKLVSVGPTASAFYRTVIGGTVLCLIVLLAGRSLWPGRKSLFWIIAAGVAFALDLFVWHKSILYVGVGLSTLLGNFQVFAMAAAGVLIFGERMSRLQLVAIPLAVLGLYLIVGVDWGALSEDYRLGVWLGLMTALAYSLYMLLMRKARLSDLSRDTAADLGVASLVSALTLALIAWYSGESLAVNSLSDMGALAAYGIVGQVLGWLAISSALPYLPAVKIGLALLIQPTFAYLWDVIIFGRQLAVLEVAGAAIAIFAIYLGSRRAED